MLAFQGYMAESARDVTALLQAWSAGDLAAREPLIAAVFDDLRQRAARHVRRERRGETLDPTELVHETYLRLVDQRRVVWRNRSHFFAIASQLMRRILVDRARAHRMPKRSGCWTRVTLDERAANIARPVPVEVLDLDDALTQLAEFDSRKSRLAEMRFFGGLTLEESAAALDISIATAERDWQAARAWLFKALRGSEPAPAPRRSRAHQVP
jgi:RNA polymerase sigma factor (TIGR02999 family)